LLIINKIIAQVLHLSIETYNNEQISKVFGRISAEIYLKRIILLVNPKKITQTLLPPAARGFAPRLLFSLKD